MPTNKRLKVDLDKRPAPQHFDPNINDYDYTRGAHGALWSILYGPDGNPISVVDGKLTVRASEIEALLTALNGNDFATQETLTTLVTKEVFNTKADVTLSALRDAIRGTSNKTLTDLATALAPLATSAKQDTLAGLVSTAANQTALQNLIGSLAAAAVTDPTASATVIQLLKGLLKQLQSGNPVAVTDSALPDGAATDATLVDLQGKIDALAAKIDAITDGTTPAVTQLSGSYVEIGGVSFAVSGGDTLRGKSTDKPAAADAHAAIPFCYYHAIDTGAIEVTDGTNWVVI